LLLEPATGIVRGADQRFVKVAFSGEISGFGGGPVLNREGLLIGIVHSKASDAAQEKADQCVRSDVVRNYLAELKIEPFAKQ